MRRAAIGQPPTVPRDPLLQWIVNAVHELARASHVDTAESIAANVAGSYQPLSANLTSWAAITRAMGFDTFVATPSSANLLALLTDGTGTGAAVFATSPTLVTPALGVATATSINKVALTAPATSATITIPDGVTLTGPAASGTAMTLGNAETVSGVKTFSGIPILSGGGASFPAIQVPSADANTLDDYEEGTWTPTITAASGTFTTVSATGSYTKIGRIVSVFLNITITTVGTAANAVLATLPFTAGGNKTVIAGRETAVVGFMLHGTIAPGGANLEILKYDNTSSIGTNHVLTMSGSYQV